MWENFDGCVTGKPTETFTTSSTGWTRVSLPADCHPRQRKNHLVDLVVALVLVGWPWRWLICILVRCGEWSTCTGWRWRWPSLIAMRETSRTWSQGRQRIWEGKFQNKKVSTGGSFQNLTKNLSQESSCTSIPLRSSWAQSTKVLWLSHWE